MVKTFDLNLEYKLADMYKFYAEQKPQPDRTELDA